MSVMQKLDDYEKKPIAVLSAPSTCNIDMERRFDRYNPSPGVQYFIHRWSISLPSS